MLSTAVCLLHCNFPYVTSADEGRIDLGGDGETWLMQVAPVNFSLRTAEEQSVLVAGFARFLNSVQSRYRWWCAVSARISAR